MVTTKTISLDEEAYERLVARKGEDESFSDVVKRLTEGKPGVGVLDESEADALERAVASGRARTRDRRDRTPNEEAFE